MIAQETLSFPRNFPIEERMGSLPRLFGKPVSLDATLDCGQTFRWKKVIGAKTTWRGVIGTSVIDLTQIDHSEIDFRVYPSDSIDEKSLTQYFGLDIDLQKILDSIRRDSFVSKAIEFGLGLRVLNQDPWECLASFMCATNTNIRNITSMVERLSAKLGKRISSPFGRFNSFPTVDKIANASLTDLSICKLGFRAKYLKETAKRLSQEELRLQDLRLEDYEKAQKILISKVLGKKRLLGIGPKVADCVLLFSLGKTNAFPIDTWMKKAIRKRYKGILLDADLASFLKSEQAQISLGTYRKLSKTFRNYFGKYAGYAQEHLYHFARNRPDLLEPYT